MISSLKPIIHLLKSISSLMVHIGRRISIGYGWESPSKISSVKLPVSGSFQLSENSSLFFLGNFI